MTDTYFTIAEPAEAVIKEKGSKFLAKAFSVDSEEQIKAVLANLRKEYYDANHHCYAYILGPEGNQFRANDDGEPNHSAGDPILGQIRSKKLTNTLVVVIRYFGGTKLGVGGLIQAYKLAAAEALDNVQVVEKVATEVCAIHFTYEKMNDVMRLVKELGLKVIDQQFDLDCELRVEVRRKLTATFHERIKKLQQVRIV